MTRGRGRGSISGYSGSLLCIVVETVMSYGMEVCVVNVHICAVCGLDTVCVCQSMFKYITGLNMRGFLGQIQFPVVQSEIMGTEMLAEKFDIYFHLNHFLFSVSFWLAALLSNVK